MFTQLQLAVRFIWYYITASNGRGHGIHSPFVFSFVREVLKDHNRYSDLFFRIEKKRKEFRSSDQILEVLDLGAGSVSGKNPMRTVGSIAKNAAKPARFGRLFFRLIQYYKIQSVLELGTSLGLTTRYLAAALPDGDVFTIEGSPEIAAFTESNLKKEGYDRVKLIQGDFDQELNAVLDRLNGRKLIFFDGNHRLEPTLCYFKQVLPLCKEDDILVFDDIHWSEEMDHAWKEIKKNKEVSLTIDLFFIGLVFFRKEFKEKQDFIIRF
jgi:predicted O-methyltransferase YrrM